MHTWRQKFERMRASLYAGLLAPQIIGILFAWQQRMSLNWFMLVLALLVNLILFMLLHSYLIKPGGDTVDWYCIFLLSLASSLFVVSTCILQGGWSGGAAILAAVPIGFYTAVVAYLQQFSALRSRTRRENVAPAAREARLTGATLVGLITLAILLDCLLGIYPWYASIAILTTFPLLFALYQIDQDLQLRISARGAFWQTVLLFSIALLVHGLIGV
ncbi:hypothetical protein [Dictyobacter aurantiacus]|uniref:1,4-dihydroxy-2-naphthoate octaprenyltransferase n=1 Tax=Dictyobacter aurantiacus TaxID=1936993 RepID=A0A401Z802_9CHLR|nr:hypothetical protein [Dictyobacter aurantiacus]GCE02984.1 hypothetical protein KDAU_03130 [Dictyobacter aurantiacus]